MVRRDSKDSPVSTDEFEVEVDLTASQQGMLARKGEKRGRSRKQTALLNPNAIESFQDIDRPTVMELPSLEGLRASSGDLRDDGQAQMAGEGAAGSLSESQSPPLMKTSWPPEVAGPPVEAAAPSQRVEQEAEDFSLKRSAQVRRATVLMSTPTSEPSPWLWAAVVFFSVLAIGLLILMSSLYLNRRSAPPPQVAPQGDVRSADDTPRGSPGERPLPHESVE